MKVGQVLARLDTTRLEAQAQQNEAALEAARAKVLQAQASVQEAEAQLARLNRVQRTERGQDAVAKRPGHRQGEPGPLQGR